MKAIALLAMGLCLSAQTPSPAARPRNDALKKAMAGVKKTPEKPAAAAPVAKPVPAKPEPAKGEVTPEKKAPKIVVPKMPTSHPKPVTGFQPKPKIEPAPEPKKHESGASKIGKEMKKEGKDVKNEAKSAGKKLKKLVK